MKLRNKKAQDKLVLLIKPGFWGCRPDPLTRKENMLWPGERNFN